MTPGNEPIPGAKPKYNAWPLAPGSPAEEAPPPVARQRIVRLLALLEQETKSPECSPSDRALWHLLKRWESELPEINDLFHKKFRQVAVTDSGHTDMAIWNLLHHSKMFWRLFERVQDEKQPDGSSSATAAESGRGGE